MRTLGKFIIVVGAVVLAVGIVYVTTRPSTRTEQRTETTGKNTGERASVSVSRLAPTKPAVAPKADAAVAPGRLTETTPMVSSSIEELVAEARSAMDRRSFDKAAASLSKALAETNEPDTRMSLGLMQYECLVRTQAYDEALALGRELLTLSPTPEERLTLNRQLAALLFQMKRPADAEALLSQALGSEQDPLIREKYVAQLRSIWRHTPGRTDEVVSNLNVRVQADPRDEAALRQLGDIYLKSRRDFKEAQSVYEQLSTLHPEDPQLQATLVGIYRENQNYDGVRRVYESQLSQSGEDPTLRFQIAQTELQAGRGDAAVAYAEQYISGDDATPFQLQMLSSLYNKAGRKDAALATLDAAIGLETNAQQRVSMQFQKTDMLIWNKQYDAAETLLRSIIASAGDDQQTISRAKGEIVRIYEMQGKMSELTF